MKPRDSKQEFTRFVKKSGVKLAALTPPKASKSCSTFTEGSRFKGCPFDARDMLLYQWGVYDDSDGGQSLHFDITRQLFIPAWSRWRRRDEVSFR